VTKKEYKIWHTQKCIDHLTEYLKTCSNKKINNCKEAKARFESAHYLLGELNEIKRLS